MSRITPLDLHHIHHGTTGPPLLILHGLLGSSRNWRSVAQFLARDFSVVTVDLRNHGQSPHADDMDFAHLVADVCSLIESHRWAEVHLLGHSLGGKVAMALALNFPDLLKTLMVVDIAPVAYKDRYSEIVRCLQAMRITQATSRAAIDRELAESIPDSGLRQFLLMNLVATSSGFRWSANLDALLQALPKLSSFPHVTRVARFTKPTLFIAGGRSDYVGRHHLPAIHHLFPAAQITRLDRAGHWPHVENADEFMATLGSFLRSAASSSSSIIGRS